MINYKKKYIQLKQTARHSGKNVYVMDDPNLYFGFLIECTSKRHKPLDYFIFIRGRLTYKEKLFTLAHELGHVAILRDKKLIFTSEITSEEESNVRAINILDYLGVKKATRKYFDFYNDIKRLLEVN